VGIVSGCRPSEFEGKKYYWAEIKGRSVFTSEEKLGTDLFAAEGREIEALVRPGKKPNRYILVDFHFPQSI
jgi:ribosomal 30S subunit maturation factor RimM